MSDCATTNCECTTTECYVVIGIFLVLFYLFVIWFASRYPIRDSKNLPRQLLSVVMAFFLFPIYALIYAFQNPLQTNGVDQPFATLFVVFFIWPAVFFLPLLTGKGEKKVLTSTKVIDII